MPLLFVNSERSPTENHATFRTRDYEKESALAVIVRAYEFHHLDSTTRAAIGVSSLGVEKLPSHDSIICVRRTTALGM
jgi:hypothetical protein